MAAGTVELYRGGMNLATPHGPDAYPGHEVVHPAGWAFAVIIPADGRAFTALGGERLHAYKTARGAAAEGFTLHRGDRVTRLRADLPHALAEWRVERAAR